MTLLDPRRHLVLRASAAPGILPGTMRFVGPEPAKKLPPRTLARGDVIQANGGGGVCILARATVAELLWLRGHIDAAIEKKGAVA